MVNRLPSCDPDRLRSYLDEALSVDQQARLSEHLDHCGNCQRTLERLAAGSRLWSELPQLGYQPEPPTSSFSRDGRLTRPSENRGSAASREGLEFLSPSDSPAHLGRLGSYEVLDVLGEGGMGIVLKAFDTALNRIVAIKVLAPQMAASGAARRRFAREAKAAAAVVHDHVVAIHAVDTEPDHGLPYLVMPYVAGHSLQERIDRTGPMPIQEVLRIGMQMSLGLAAAHAQGLVHRDIKPSNILLENGLERVKITDFGLARAVDDASQSQSGFVAGTPQYMSPEQARGESVDHRADLFSLGSVLYAMCAGHSPFRAKTTMGVLRRVAEDSPRLLSEINPEVSEELEAVIARLHAKDPSQRYQSASEVADELGRQLAELQRPGARRPRRSTSTESRPIHPVTKKTKEPIDEISTARSARSRIATALVTAVVIAGLGMAGFSIRQASFGTPPSGGGLSFLGAAEEPQKGGQPARVTIVNDDNARTIVGSGKPATKRWELADFTGVEIMHPFRTEITRADGFEVTVTADDNVLEHIVVAKEGPRLRVRLEDNWTYRLKRDALKAKITLPAIESLGLSHGAHTTIAGFESKRPFAVKTSHGSRLEGSISAGQIEIDASHGSNVALKGTAESALIKASHGSNLPLGELVVRDAEIELVHGSRATIDSRPEKSLRAGVEHGSILAGTVQGGELTLKAEHGSQVSLKGTAQKAGITGSHSGRLSLGELALEAADIRLEFGASATVQAKSKLAYQLSHTSSLRYLGNPTIARSVATQGSSARAIRADELKGAAGAAPSASNRPADPPEARPRDDDREIMVNLRSTVHNLGGRPVIEGSGRKATKTVEAKDFNKILIDRMIDAEIARAETFAVSLAADDNILERIEVIRDDASLRIRLAEGNYRLHDRPHATITLPTLEAIHVAGASRATIQGFKSDRPFRGEASGASKLEGSIQAGEVDFIASGASTLTLRGSSRGARLLASGASKLELAEFSVEAGNVTIDTSGASVVRLRGSAQAAVLKAQGASHLSLANLALEAADVELAGASRATCRIKRLLDYDLSSASRLEYLGTPTIGKARKSGESVVVHP
jgi:serine/threonine protein kinase